MMLKRAVVGSMVLAVAVALLLGASPAWGKAHVPLGRAQICTANGSAKNVAARAVLKRIDGGACRLTACVFNDVDNGDLVQQFIFFPGDPCDPTDDDGDGFCDATGAPSDIPRDLKANNLTPACTDPF